MTFVCSGLRFSFAPALLIFPTPFFCKEKQDETRRVKPAAPGLSAIAYHHQFYVPLPLFPGCEYPPELLSLRFLQIQRDPITNNSEQFRDIHRTRSG